MRGRERQAPAKALRRPGGMAKTGAFFLFVFAACAGLATFAQINPIWLFGPYNPAAGSADSQADFYIGWLEGALRMMPAWQINSCLRSPHIRGGRGEPCAHPQTRHGMGKLRLRLANAART